MRKKLASCLLVSLVAANALIFAACSDDESPATSGGTDSGLGTDSTTIVPKDSGNAVDSANANKGHITGTMDYKGTAVGPMQVVFYTSYPPSGPPPYLKRINTPVWPQSWDLYVEPGHYTVLGNIIVGAEHLGLGTKDPRSPGAPGSITLDIAAGETKDVSWTYVDPPPPSDAGDAGDSGDAPADG